MKKTTTLITLILVLLLALTACSGATAASTEAATTADASGTPMPGTAAAGGELPESMQLVLGTLSLAESDTPLTAEQAAALLPLWKAVRSLGESDTAAQAEIDALYTQIHGTLSEEQLAAIEAMPFTRESMATISQQLGIDTGFGGMGNASPEMQATVEALRASGQMPEGGPGFFLEGGAPPDAGSRPSGGDMPAGGIPGGGGMPGGGMEMDPSAMATAQASGVNPPALNNTISGPWLDALITMLEGIASGQ